MIAYIKKALLWTFKKLKHLLLSSDPPSHQNQKTQGNNSPNIIAGRDVNFISASRIIEKTERIWHKPEIKGGGIPPLNARSVETKVIDIT